MGSEQPKRAIYKRLITATCDDDVPTGVTHFECRARLSWVGIGSEGADRHAALVAEWVDDAMRRFAREHHMEVVEIDATALVNPGAWVIGHSDAD